MRLRSFSFRGPDEWALMHAWLETGWIRGEATEVAVGDVVPLRDDWLEHYPSTTRKRDDLDVEFGDRVSVYTMQSGDTPGRAVGLTDYDSQVTLDDVLHLLPQLPFHLGVGRDIHSWHTRYDDPPNAGFGEGLFDHGWAAFLRGPGHDQVAHRRVLEHGPWRTIRLPEHDITLIQFHDLDADPDLAFEQAKPGHYLLGYSSVDRAGCFFHRDTHRPRKGSSALYDPDNNELIATVAPGTRPDRRRMQDIAWKRQRMNDQGEQPVDKSTFVFVDEADARRSHPALWLRGFDVRYFDGPGNEVPIDEVPTFDKPDWVKRLQDSEGR